jgi:hypothetical protein
MTWRLNRYPILMILIALIPLGIYNIYHDVKSEFRDINVQSDLRARSPGCVPGAENIDLSLAPCTDGPATVVDVTSRHEGSKVYVSGVTVYGLTIRDQWGNLHHYDHVWENFAASRRPGEIVSAKYWRGQIQDLTAGSDHYITYEMSPKSHRTFAAMYVGLFVSLFIAPALIRLVCVFWQPRPRAYALF